MPKNKVKLEKKNSSNNLSKTLILGLIGLILLLIPASFNKFIGLIVGFSLLLIGIIQIIKYVKNKDSFSNIDLISGILYSALGIIIILNPHAVMELVTVCLGIYLIINGLIKVKLAITLKQLTNRWIGTLVMAIVTIILGFLLIFNPFGSVVAITQLMGAFLVIVTLFDLIDSYIIQK